MERSGLEPTWRPPAGTPEPPRPEHGAPSPGPVQPPGGYWQPPPGWYPAYGFPPPPAPPRPTGPANDAAVGGFCLSITAAVLLVFSTGIASPLTLILAIVGMILSRRGRGRVERGETDRHRDLAQAGFVVGIVALVLSLLALLFWGAILVVAILAEQSGPGSSPGGLDPVRATLVEIVRR